jgi:hypothetical protein
MTHSGFRRHFARSLIATWAGLMITVVAFLMVGHWVVLPHPAKDDSQWAERLSATRSKPESEWTVFHFLYGNCPCSRRVLDHVLTRKPIDGIRELIVFIGDDSEIKSAKKCGFEVECVTPEILKERYGVEAAPLLVVADPSSKIRYSGGYTARKQSLDIQDREIIERILSGESLSDLPLFGCAVSSKLKFLVDPLRLKK